MVNLFQKVGNSAGRLFSKAINTPNIFRKIDNSVVKVAHFLGDVSKVLPLGVGGPLAEVSREGARLIHGIRSGLEKTTRKNDLEDSRKSIYN